MIAALRGLNGQFFADTAQMDIVGGDITVIQVSETPKSMTVPERDGLQFAGNGSLSYGGTVIPAINWSATSGSIDTTGLYVAPR